MAHPKKTSSDTVAKKAKSAKYYLANEVSDSVFVDITHFLKNLRSEIEGSTGIKPSGKDLFNLMLVSWENSLLSKEDAFPLEIREGKIKKIMPRAGDIVAIPASSETFYLAVYLLENTYGSAYGIFKGIHSTLPSEDLLHPFGRPIYSGTREIEAGKWPIMGNNPNLVSKFSPKPEIYHNKSNHRNNPTIGEYGSGENANHELRNLTKEEAEEIGLLSNEYDQCMLGDTLERYLAQKLK